MSTHPAFTSSAELNITLQGEVLWLTITREERRNAMSHAVLHGMTPVSYTHLTLPTKA